ncbi:MAG: MFS transporter [Candidatus Abyssobacteria bacterium SURF_17]|uniref:MFS transporter n=1 Tax=Candidatus Abyssobacteria bacterium SURF_17 TaxID=2093361 RepID=A0A419EUQ9_9BACT|nr:MAG: MFS transporter [Candidatus Abyssubacteria bacterium SURF_17]
MESREREDLKNSIYEGMLAHVFATLTGGMFLTGFALYLGMDELKIGLLGAMPFMVAVFQLPASHLMEKHGGRRRVWFWSSAIGRVTWLSVLIFALMPILPTSFKMLIVLCLIFLSYSCNSVSSVSWLSLMSDIVPEGIRGRFFGTRNMLCGTAGMIAILVFGNSLDYLREHLSEGLPLGFSIIFGSAVLAGVWSLRFLNRIREPQVKKAVHGGSFQENAFIAFKDANFRRFILFALAWSFSVHFAAPFFTLYFLRDMGFSYGFVAVLNITAATADLLGMRLWGGISDKVRNRPIIRVGTLITAFIPLAWILVTPQSRVLPILINTVAGLFWAGINLCMNNMLLRISPRENKSMFLSTYNILAGLGAASGPILAGWILKSLADANMMIFSWKVLPIYIIFLVSAAGRLISRNILRNVREPEEGEVGELIRILGSIRGLNVASGFNYLLHPFIAFAKNSRNRQ